MVRRMALVVLLACAILSGLASGARAASFYWYGQNNSTCWQTAKPGTPSSEACDGVGEGFLTVNGLGEQPHLINNNSGQGSYVGTTLGASGDYCIPYELGDNLVNQDAVNAGPATGDTTQTPYQSYQESSTHENVCQADGSEWGYEVRTEAPANKCYSPACGMQHYVSFRGQGENDRPWSSEFEKASGKENSLVVSDEAGTGVFVTWEFSKPKEWAEHPDDVGAWGYVCPILEDTSTSPGEILEYCLQEWRSKYNISEWQEEHIGECKSPEYDGHHQNMDEVLSYFWPGTQYVEHLEGETFVLSQPYQHGKFKAAITEADVARAAAAANAHCAGHHFSTEPKNYVLIGVENGIEGWRDLTEMGGYDRNLQLYTNYDPPPPTVTTMAPTNVQEVGATLNATVNPNGLDTHYYFQWGTTTSYGNSLPLAPGNDAGSGKTTIPVNVALGSLTPGETYHYRIVAASEEGTSYGQDMRFETANQPTAVVTKEGTEYVYFRGANGGIWQANTSGEVQELGGHAIGSPTAVALSTGEQDVYFENTGGSISRLYFNPENKTWTLSEIGGSSAGIPTVAAGKPYSVFFRQETGCHACIYQSYSVNGGSTWTTRAIGGEADNNPMVVTTPSGGEQVFFTQTEHGGIAEWSAANAVGESKEWQYAYVGGPATNAKPAAVVYSSGKGAVFFEESTECQFCDGDDYWNGTSWSYKTGVGALAGGPVAVAENEGEQKIYWRGGNSIWYNYGPASEPWKSAQLGGNPGGTPAEIYNSTTTGLYYDEQSGGLMHMYLEKGEWHSQQICAWPCEEKGPQRPKITSVSPSGGAGTGGTSVTISGANLSEVQSVMFGPIKARSFTVNSSSSITAVAPEGVGTVDVMATNSQGTSTITSADRFTYTAYTSNVRPSAVLLPDGSEDVYYRGENGAIWQATSYGAVRELGGKAAGNPAAVALSTGEQDVYFKGTNEALWRWHFNPESKSWSLSEIGGSTVGEPTVATGKPYSVFFRQETGCHACIYQSYSVNGGSTWTTRAIGGEADNNPMVVTTPSGGEQVFFTQTEHGGIAEWSAANAVGESKEWQYTYVGGPATNEKPAPVVYSSGKEAVFFEESTECQFCDGDDYYNGTSWSYKAGVGALAGGPVAVAESESDQKIFWRGGNIIWYNYGPASEPWKPVGLGYYPAGNPAEVYAPGAAVPTSLYYIDQMGGLTDQYMSNGEWHTKQMCEWPCAAQNPPAPVVSAAPVLSTGTPQQGGAVTSTSGTWSGEPAITSVYQWQDCNSSGNECVNISGANSASYTPVAGDVGDTLRAVVTATNAGGHGEARSAASGVVPAQELVVQSSPNPSGSTNTRFAGVSCYSAAACTSVGYSVNSSGAAVTLAERWNGSEWAIQSTPNPSGAKESYLHAASCGSSSTCIAVGNYINSAGLRVPLAESWSGTEWTVQSAPNPSGAEEAYLKGLDCISSSVCTAVGYYVNSSGVPVTLAERWNGTEWAIQTTQNPSGAKASELFNVSCTASTACTATGRYKSGTNGMYVNLAERWNGTEWSIQSTPNPSGAKAGELYGVSCTSSTACMAVGYYQNSSGTNETLAERWNGTEWTIQSTPDPGGAKVSALYGISCVSSTACTAVGYSENGSGASKAMAEIWNGTEWVLMGTNVPSETKESNVYSVSCTTATACTTAGLYENNVGNYYTLSQGEVFAEG
jgi:IPT/TIG domain-containing protein